MAKSLHVFMLMILVLYVLKSTLATKSLSHADECSMLFQFKENMFTDESAPFDLNDYSRVASWKVNKSDCCLWDGVECSGKSSGHVIALDLSGSFLYGPINSNTTLFSLIHLRRLNLAYNDFRYSQIPSELGRLSKLEYLNLSYSFFSGQIPKEISQLSRLISLDLSGNSLKLKSHGFRNLVQDLPDTLRDLFLPEVSIDSEVPVILADFSSLRSLVLRDCGLRGDFPINIFHLPMLQVVDVSSNNDLSGYLPMFHGGSQLKNLILAETNFHGNVPASIGNLIHLDELDLSECDFSGTLPGSVSNLTQLTLLMLDDNRFWGRIPSLASLSKLNYLILSYNEFDGRNLSDWLGKLPNLLSLDLMVNNLSCEIPSSIGNQTQLKQLYLSYNNMVGQIPSSLMNLTHLTNLILGYNQFSGGLPSLESLSNLTELALSFNKFDPWKLPDWLGKLNKLISLQVVGVNLDGQIPSSIVNLTQIQELVLSYNQIQGPIPPFLSTMAKLRQLDLSDNHLKGPIPSSLSNLQNLGTLALNDNNIGGTVEVDIFLALKKLTLLALGGNRISLSDNNNNHTKDTQPKFLVLDLESCNLKVFPGFLRFQDQLLELKLDDNNIYGLIPKWMANVGKKTLQSLSLSQNSVMGFEEHWPVLPWVDLRLLDLSHNMLHGSIPVSPPTTTNLLLSNNKLSGKIPPSICDLQSLQLLDLSFNNIRGSIPPCLDKLNSSLLVLDLRGNGLRGTIPNVFTDASKLLLINLSENQLQGQLPRSLGDCASLQILDLGNNFLEDMFPFWLGALSQLQVLILRFNKFHGALLPSKTNSKFPKLRIIDISFNSFSGDLPHRYFDAWSAMKETGPDASYLQAGVDFVADKYLYFGNYSYSMNMTNKGVKTEYVKILNIFVAVDFSSNKFGGKIPESIKSLGSLQLLNLSNNELSGVIPSSMGKLTRLESLDISSNKLSGRMPQELVQLNFLAFLNVSYNKLTGPIPQGGQFSTFQNNSYMGNLALCGSPLSKNCGGDPKVSTPSAVSSDGNESDFPSGVDWVVIAAGVGSGLVVGLLFGDHLLTSCYRWFLKRFRK